MVGEGVTLLWRKRERATDFYQPYYVPNSTKTRGLKLKGGKQAANSWKKGKKNKVWKLVGPRVPDFGR